MERLSAVGIITEPRYPADDFHALRARVGEAFEVPQTSITPIMSRTLFALSASLRPRRIVGIGTYAGNGLVWLAGPALWGRRATDAQVVGCDIDPGACELARRNFRRLDSAEPVELRCCDGHELLAEGDDPIDVLYLDADDPTIRKGVYRSLLEQALPRLRPDAVVLAHDVMLPIFAADLRPYLEMVREGGGFRASLALAVDGCGLELTIR